MNKIYEISEKYKFPNKDKLKAKLEEHFYLTDSELLEILNILNEIYIVKDIDPIEFIEEEYFLIDQNKKKNGKRLLDMIRGYRYPYMSKILGNLNSIIRKISNKSMKIEVPKNLEGQGIKIVLDIKNEADWEKISRVLIKHEKEIKELTRIVNRGD